MELYASFARERQDQVLAIFIRDAGGDRSLPLNDPTGENGMFGWDPAAGVRTSSGYPEGTVTGSMTQQPAGEPAPGIDVVTPRPRSAPRIITTPRVNSYSDPGSNSSLGSGSGFASNQAYPYFAPNKPQGYSSSPRRTVPEPSMSMSFPITEEPTSLPTPTGPNSSSASYPPSPSSSHVRLPNASNPYQPHPPPIIIPTTKPSRASSVSSTFSGRMNSGTPTTAVVSEPERRQADLQMRVYRARMDLPRHIVLRVFREPEECFADARRILDRMHLGKKA